MLNGTIRSLGSDHVPFFPKEGKDLWAEKPGIVSFPWELALLLDEGVHKRGLPLTRRGDSGCTRRRVPYLSAPMQTSCSSTSTRSDRSCTTVRARASMKECD